MTTLFAVILVIAGFIALLLIIGFFMKREHSVNCEILINAPLPKVFDYLRMLKNQAQFNKHAKVDPNRKEEFKGTDGTVGYIYSWSGNKSAGCGEKEIMNIIEGKRIEMEIRFIKPMVTSATIIMEIEYLSENQTKVVWMNKGKLKYPFNIMIPMFEKMFAKDIKISLSTLKNILEK